MTACCSAMPDVEEALAECASCELVEPGAGRHRRGDRARPACRCFASASRASREDVVCSGRARRRLGLRAGDHVELLDAMIFVRRRLGRGIALALLVADVDRASAPRPQSRTFSSTGIELVEIMPVDRPDIIETQLLEEGAAHRHAARELVGLLGRLVQRRGQLAREALGELAQLEERRGWTRSARDRPKARPPAARSTCRCR